MAKNSPAFQFYPSDFLCGTAGMTDAEIGIYIRTLCHLWIAGNRIPDDDARLASMVASSRESFDQSWPVVRQKLDAVGDHLMHRRLEEMIAIREKRKAAGEKGGKQTQKQKRKQTPKQNGKQMNGTVSAKCSTDDWSFPDGWDTPEARRALEDWAEMRRKKRVPVKSKANTSKLFKSFDDVEHLIYACDFATANEYQGIKPDYRPPRRPGPARSVGQQMLETTF